MVWGVSLLLTVLFWWQSLQSRTEAALDRRKADIQLKIPQLTEDFQTLEQFGRVMAQASTEAGQTSREDLARQGLPFYELQVVGAESEAEPWLEALVATQAEAAGVKVLYPLPPGYLAGRMPLPEVSPPEQFFLYCNRKNNGSCWVWVLRWEHIFGPWLDRRLREFAAVDEVSWKLQEQSADEPVSSDALKWSYKVPALLPDQVTALPELVIIVDNHRLVENLRRRHIYLLGLVVFVFLAVGLSLRSNLRARRSQAEYLEAKERFVSMVGHELRTPLTAIEMYLEILRENLVENEEKRREYHQTLQRESHRLRRLLENLLTAGIAGSGEIKLSRSEFSLNELLEELVTTENRTERSIRVKTAADSPAIVADREALYGVFSNLLNNAMKYSEEEIEIEAAVRDGRAHISVGDRGPGADDYKALFEPYFRATNSKSGVGLGLALVKLLVEAHRGTVRGESREGGGSLFRVELPLK